MRRLALHSTKNYFIGFTDTTVNSDVRLDLENILFHYMSAYEIELLDFTQKQRSLASIMNSYECTGSRHYSMNLSEGKEIYCPIESQNAINFSRSLKKTVALFRDTSSTWRLSSKNYVRSLSYTLKYAQNLAISDRHYPYCGGSL